MSELAWKVIGIVAMLLCLVGFSVWFGVGLNWALDGNYGFAFFACCVATALMMLAVNTYHILRDMGL